MDMFAEQDEEGNIKSYHDPSNPTFPRSVDPEDQYGTLKAKWEPTSAFGRFVQAILYLPVRSKTHVTVSYIPARTKPGRGGGDGDGDEGVPDEPDPWYIPRPPKPRSAMLSAKNRRNRRKSAGRRDSKYEQGLVSGTGNGIGRWKRRLRSRAKQNDRKSRASVFMQAPIMGIIETDPGRRSRYALHSEIIKGQPFQVFSEDAPPVLVGPDGVVIPQPQTQARNSQGWFTDAQG
jgi:hypothetical protein